MSVTPPLPGGHTTPPFDADAQAIGATPNRWGTVTGGLRSPPPAPSSGAGVRRNHTIHGARHPGKHRLEKHFEQPEDYVGTPHTSDGASAEQASHGATTSAEDHFQGLESPRYSRNGPALDLLSSPSTRSDSAGDFVSSLTPLQALYSKTSVSRNLSLPSRHTSKLASQLPHSATQGRTSLFNSLSAITGGSDLDEHDWEKLIHSSNALGDEHQQDPNASHSLSMQTEDPWSSSLSSQRQLGTATDLSHPTSPIARSNLFSDAHHRSGSSSAVDHFDQTASAESHSLGGSASFVRRHQSLNHHSGRSAAHRLAARSTDLLSHYAGDVADPAVSSYSSRTDAAFSPVRHSTSLSAASSPVMPTSFSKAPWNQSTQDPIGSPSRFAAPFTSQNLDSTHHRMPSGIDGSSTSLAEVSKALSSLEVSGSSALAGDDALDTQASVTPMSRSMFPTTPSHSSAVDGRPLSARKLPQLVTSRDALQRGQRVDGTSGPFSAAAFVPPIGHAHARHQSNDLSGSNATTYDAGPSQRFGPFTAAPAGSWPEKDSIAGRFDGGRPNADAVADSQAWPQQQSPLPYQALGMDPNVMALSMALAQEQQRNAILQAQLGARNNAIAVQEPHLFGMQPIDLNGAMHTIGQQLRGAPLPSSPPIGGMGSLPQRGTSFPVQQSQAPFRSPLHVHAPPSRPPGLSGSPDMDAGGNVPPTPVDPTTLAFEKGYNPPPGTFDVVPPTARFFVIKSYTEDDVHKSLKYEIWASTDKGNQRLDKAFRESARDGPIYLFYSVNASGHFCGMAQMLTPLDYTTSSNVWAQDGKWKGTFKVRWIYVKDLPNNQLRHIRLTNTAECKPVTQSRDTQELTPEAGREVLRIMAEYTAKTSLLQDFNFYEMQGRGQGVAPQQALGTGVARPAPNSPAIGGLGGLQLRNSPQPNGSPALGFGALPYPTSPNLNLGPRPLNNPAASPKGGTPHRPHQPSGGTPQRLHAISGLGLAPGTPRMNNGATQPISDLRSSERTGEATTANPGVDKDALSAAQTAGLAPSAL